MTYKFTEAEKQKAIETYTKAVQNKEMFDFSALQVLSCHYGVWGKFVGTLPAVTFVRTA